MNALLFFHSLTASRVIMFIVSRELAIFFSFATVPPQGAGQPLLVVELDRLYSVRTLLFQVQQDDYQLI
jgi:hypothetical protein